MPRISGFFFFFFFFFFSFAVGAFFKKSKKNFCGGVYDRVWGLCFRYQYFIDVYIVAALLDGGNVSKHTYW